MYEHTHIQIHTQSHTFIHTHTPTHTLIHTHPHSFIHTHSYIHSHTLIHTHSFILTHIRTSSAWRAAPSTSSGPWDASNAIVWGPKNVKHNSIEVKKSVIQ